MWNKGLKTNGPNIMPEWCKHHPKMMQQSCKNNATIIPRLSPNHYTQCNNHQTMMHKSSTNDSKLIQTWSTNVAKAIPKLCKLHVTFMQRSSQLCNNYTTQTKHMSNIYQHHPKNIERHVFCIISFVLIHSTLYIMHNR